MSRSLYIDVGTSKSWDFEDKEALSVHQPHLVRLALLEIDGNDVVAEHCHLVKLPVGVTMTSGASLANGITDAHLALRGVPLPDALNALSEMYSRLAEDETSQVIAFSWQFAKHVIDISYRRIGHHVRDWFFPIYDMMNHGAPLVGKERQKPGGGFLYPKFNELTMKVMDRVLVPSRDPLRDGLDRIRAMQVCHQACLDWERQKGLID